MQSDMAANLQMIGQAALLDLPDKVAFLSSRRISAADVLKCYEWAEKIRDTETCVVSGFQSPLEKDVLKFLLRGRVSIILVLARSLWKTIPEELRDPVGLGRLLIVSLVSATRASTATATACNRWILANCTSLVLGSLDPGGSLARLVVMFPVANMICLQGEARGPAPIG